MRARYCLLAAVLGSVILLAPACRQQPPGAPELLAGSSRGIVGDSCRFTAVAVDAGGGPVAIQFDWGDGSLSDWSEYVASGDSVAMYHRWDSAATYHVGARARTEAGALSDWATSAIAIVACPTWMKTYGYSNPDHGYSVEQTADGGFFVVGLGCPDPIGGVYLLRVDAWGQQLWSRVHGGSIANVGYSGLQLPDGGYVAAGMSGVDTLVGTQAILLRTDATGETLWTRLYGGSDGEEARVVRQTADGGFIIAGYSGHVGAGRIDCYFVRTGASGDTLWTRVVGGVETDFCMALEPTADGGFIAAGYTNSFGAGDRDAYVVKFAANGDTAWTRTCGGSGGDEARSVQQTADGGFIVAGWTTSYGAGASDVYLVKLDPAGNVLWEKTVGGSSYDACNSVRQTSDGGYILTGYTESFGAARMDLLLVKTDAVGDTLWVRVYGGRDLEGGEAVRQTADGGYVVVGSTASEGAGSYDVWLIKTDSLGKVNE
ncbi:MAG: hypothetical protein R6X13_09605 [bacterium]